MMWALGKDEAILLSKPSTGAEHFSRANASIPSGVFAACHKAAAHLRR
jgi:hypothetical protein